MKKSGLAIIALFLLLPFAAEAKGRRIFSATNPKVTPPQFVSGDVAKAPEGIHHPRVLIHILVKKDGGVISYGAVDRTANPKAIKAAEKAVQGWRFKPATKSWTAGCTTPVNFSMVVEVPVDS